MRSVAIPEIRLAELPFLEKSRLPVSIATDAQGNRTVINRYEDDVWNFWPYIARENIKDSEKKIIWGISLPDGTKLTDEQHCDLLTSAKDFVWSLHVDPIEGLKRPGMKTLISTISNLAFLVRWMLSRGIKKFSGLDGRTMEYCISARDGDVALTTVKHRLQIIEKLHAQAGKIDDFLPNHPWPFESATVLAGIDQRMSHRIPKTPIIPEAVFIKLAKIAIEYVNERSDNIINAVSKSEAAIMNARRNGITNYHYSFVFGTEIARGLGYNGLRDIHIEMAMLRTACYICINMFSGLRNSEMMSLETNCIVKEPGIDGSYECIWLHGTIYKTSERPHKWLVPPIVERAVKIAERIVQPYQSILLSEKKEIEKSASTEIVRAKRLSEIEKASKKLFVTTHYSPNGSTATLPSNSVVNKWLKDFCRHYDIRDSSGEIWNLATHQFRRSFAYNYARSELGDLLYLKEHYGHWSLDMTILYAEGGADGYQVDNGLLEDVMHAKQQRQAEILTSYLTSDVPLAKGGDWLGAWRPMVRTAKNKEELIQDLSSTISLNGTGHSWCAGNAKGGNCGGLCVHEADMCVDCNAAIIGPEHLPVWREIAEQQRSVIQLTDVGVMGKSRAKRILAKANQIIAALDSNGTEKMT